MPNTRSPRYTGEHMSDIMRARLTALEARMRAHAQYVDGLGYRGYGLSLKDYASEIEALASALALATALDPAPAAAVIPEGVFMAVKMFKIYATMCDNLHPSNAVRVAENDAWLSAIHAHGIAGRNPPLDATAEPADNCSDATVYVTQETWNMLKTLRRWSGLLADEKPLFDALLDRCCVVAPTSEPTP